MMDGPQRNINAADLNHFKCKCLSCGVMQMRTEWKRLKLFPLLNANMFLTHWGWVGGVGVGCHGEGSAHREEKKMNMHKMKGITK